MSCRSAPASVQGAWNAQRERWYFRVERGSIVGDHLVTTLHRANWRFKNSTTGVLEAGARHQIGLFADHTLALNLARLFVGVSNDPAPGNQARRHRTGVGNGDGVGEDITILARLRLAGKIRGADINLDLVFVVGDHGRH